ncbi:ion transporter [Endothiovibrio diazotrophicus]
MTYLEIRKRVAEILEVSHRGDPTGRAVDLFLIGMIMLNVGAIIIESVPSVYATYESEFFGFEFFSVLVFSVEYLFRVWSSIDRPNAFDRNPLSGRLRYMLTATAIIDLLAILPFLLGIFTAVDLRFLRVIRLLRVLKLTRYSPAMNVLLDVLSEERRAFGASFFMLFVMLILAASGIYMIEHKVQPEAFGSIPEAMWWAMATLTTVGYGDVTPITPLGKFFGGMITVIGVGMVALPSGILASGFAEQMRRRRDEYAKRVHEVLEDGHISQEERWELEYLRTELGLDEADARRLLDKIARKNLHLVHHRHCPHCGESLHQPNRAASNPPPSPLGGHPTGPSP